MTILSVVKVSVVLLAALGALRGLRRAPAALRHFVLLLALAGPVAFLVFGALAVDLPLPLLPARAALPDSAPAQLDASPTLASDTEADAGRGSRARSEQTRGRRSSDAISRGLSGVDWVSIAWGLGFAGSLGWLALGVGRLGWISRRARVVPEGSPWQLDARQLARRLGIRRPVGIRVTEASRVPATWGVTRPTILLPPDALDWTASARRTALIHELAHIRRHDWAAQVGARIVRAVHWFNPLCWVVVRRLGLEAERAADDWVLRAGHDGPDYADQLVMLARTVSRGSPQQVVCHEGLAMARRDTLSPRILSILDPSQRRSPMKPLHSVLVLSIAALTVLPLGPARLVHAEAVASPGSSAGVVAQEGTLVDAARRGDLDQARRLIANGGDVEQREPGRGTPLIVAASKGDAAMIELLLEAGADPNGVESESGRRSVARTPLGAAALAGHLDIVERLLEAGAEVDIHPRGDATPLMKAARRGQFDVVQRLIEGGADVNLALRGDGTPLIEAARAGDVESTRILLAAGADPDRAVRGDGNPLIMAARSGNAEVVRMLLGAGANPNSAVAGDGNPLINAVHSGNTEVVDLLVSAGADIDRAVGGDGNALIEAAKRGEVELARSLLVFGADPNGAVRGDGSPLIMAAKHGRLDLVELLLDHGADVDLVVPGDENPLINAAAGGHLDVVRTLVDSGADVNARVFANGREWRTPLNQAQRFDHDDVVDYLISRGAN